VTQRRLYGIFHQLNNVIVIPVLTASLVGHLNGLDLQSNAVSKLNKDKNDLEMISWISLVVLESCFMYSLFYIYSYTRNTNAGVLSINIINAVYNMICMYLIQISVLYLLFLFRRGRKLIGRAEASTVMPFWPCIIGAFFFAFWLAKIFDVTNNTIEVYYPLCVGMYMIIVSIFSYYSIKYFTAKDRKKFVLQLILLFVTVVILLVYLCVAMYIQAVRSGGTIALFYLEIVVFFLYLNIMVFYFEFSLDKKSDTGASHKEKQVSRTV
jgi:hypothetical protein